MEEVKTEEVKSTKKKTTEEKMNDLMAEATKRYGKGALVKGNTVAEHLPIICSTGSFKLDLAIGCGGLPEGRIMEMYGPPSGGKTSIAIHCMREAQKAKPNKYVAFVDVENSFSREWAEGIGVNSDKLIFAQPFSGDEVFEMVDMMVQNEEISLIVIDSVSAMATKAELEGDYGDAHVGQLARLMSQGLKKLNATMTLHPLCSVIFINQIRMKIGGYGNPETTSGGESLKFYAAIRFEVRRKEVIGDKENPIGFVTTIKNVKNKVGPPFRKVETELYIGPDRFGIDNFAEIIDLATENGIVNKSGKWYNIPGRDEKEKFDGRDNFVVFLKENPTLFNTINAQVSKTVLMKDSPVKGSWIDEMNKIAEAKKEITQIKATTPQEKVVVTDTVVTVSEKSLGETDEKKEN